MWETCEKMPKTVILDEKFQNFKEIGEELQDSQSKTVKVSNDQNTLKIMWIYIT